jgi:cbb3-type cytochrome oxidase subunit 3
MDLNLIRSLLSVAVFAVFLGIVWWAYAPRRKQRFDNDALSIFKDIEP